MGFDFGYGVVYLDVELFEEFVIVLLELGNYFFDLYFMFFGSLDSKL